MTGESLSLPFLLRSGNPSMRAIVAHPDWGFLPMSTSNAHRPDKGPINRLKPGANRPGLGSIPESQSQDQGLTASTSKYLVH
jgi:hypothetical protein